ncbi:AAA family ATPase [Pseudomonas mendocina]|uniref:AAA family ATPase n=1 Tax=Ectopseudomonas mendocina TaxID=300 RepID=UPI0023DA6017|nr:AAA family ATPase [Pseudomonas mendocina]MDF2074300.1 AAA family ATPase [Pseudomonas mendocina]
MNQMTFDLPHRAPDLSPQALSWMYSLVLDCGGLRTLINGDYFTDDDIALALDALPIPEEGDEDVSRLPRYRRHSLGVNQAFSEQARLRMQHSRQQRCAAGDAVGLPDNLADNIRQLAGLIELTETDQKLLGLCAVLKTEALLEDCANLMGYMGFGRLLNVLATLLRCDSESLRHSLSSEGNLRRAGLLGSYDNGRNRLSDYLEPGHRHLLFDLRHHQGDSISLFQSVFRPAPGSTLQLSDFSHLPTLALTRAYLQRAIASRQRGVNILIYGPPGTGKSELTRVLAQALNSEMYEIACTGHDGAPIDLQGRLCALRSAMYVLEQKQTLLLLDEIEELFSDGHGFEQLFGKQTRHKGWINRMLEENPVPCFWLSNNIDALDNAYIRRFDLILQLDNPPRQQRERIVREAGGEQLSQVLVERLVAHEQLMPAVITRALQVAGQVEAEDQPLEHNATLLIDATLQAQGFAPLGDAQGLPAFYSPDLCQTDMALSPLLTGLRQHPAARLCLYGPPGTGKTAFAHWLARELGQPLHSRRASELISPYVGMTEKNFVRAFARARDERAVLLLDEVDSFLQDRRHARNSWEVSAVNEMLTQMEHYPGLFIASTNLMDNLDEAALRRFDLKISFAYLNEERSTELLRQYLKQLQLTMPDSLKLGRFIRHSRLTPGDFALLARRARFSPFADGNAFVDALLAESALKPERSTRPIGFVH